MTAGVSICVRVITDMHGFRLGLTTTEFSSQSLLREDFRKNQCPMPQPCNQSVMMFGKLIVVAGWWYHMVGWRGDGCGSPKKILIRRRRCH